MVAFARVVVAVLAPLEPDNTAHAIAAGPTDAIRDALARSPQRRCKRGAADSYGRRSLASIRQWMQENLAERMSIDDLAKRAHLSRRQFTRDFRSETGTSPAQWLLTQRLRRATRLLEVSELSVDGIASVTGFPSAAVFRTHFKRDTGCTPTGYRSHLGHQAEARGRATRGTSAQQTDSDPR